MRRLRGACKFLIGLNLGRMAVGSTYALAGSLGVFLIWVYYAALICIFSAQFTQVFARLCGRGMEASAHALRRRHKPD